jgi:hypothetical protein
MSAASTVHINIFGPHPIVVFGNEEQKQRWLPDVITGRTTVCFGVTEPDAGLDTGSIRTMAEKSGNGYVVNGKKIWTSTAGRADKILLLARTSPYDKAAGHTRGLSLFYTDLDRDYVEVREIEKMGRAAVDSNEVFIDGLPVSVEDRIGEEGMAPKPSASGKGPSPLPAVMPGIAWFSADPLARTRRFSIRWPTVGWRWKLRGSRVCALPGPMTVVRPAAPRPMPPSTWAPRPPTRPANGQS